MGKKTLMAGAAVLAALMAGAADFNVADFGAVPGGVVCTKAFDAAIAAASAAGTGRVVVPDGTWTVGSIRLRSNVELHLADGAVLAFTDNPDDYLPAVPRSTTGIECVGWSSPIYAYGCTNVSLTGRGTLAPRMDYWRSLMRQPQEGGTPVSETLYHWCATNAPLAARDLTKLPPSALGRPALLHFNRCRGVRLDGIRIRQSPYWVIHFYLSDDVTVRNVDLFAYGCNNDALDIEMTSNVLVEDCTFFGGDDGICLKAGRNADGWRLGKPTENVTVRRCRIDAAHSVLACGSELSAGIRNVLVEDCTAGAVRSVLKIKTNNRRGGFVRDVTVRNVKVRHTDAVFGIAYDGFRWKYPDYELRDTAVEDILLENVAVHNAREGVVVPPRPHLPPKNVRLRNVTVDRLCGELVRMPDATGVALDNVTVLQPGVPRTGVVFDRLENAGRYAAISPNFAKAIEFLRRPDLFSLEPGRYAIDGTEVFANVEDVRLRPLEESRAEVHRDYADIQMTFGSDRRGGPGSKEFVGFGDLPSGVTFPPFKPGRDATVAKAVLPVAPICENLFMIAFPGAVHAPCLSDGATTAERKICIKVRMNPARRDVPFQKGMTWGFGHVPGYFASAAAHAEVDRMYDDGIRWIVLTPNVWQETFASTRQYDDYGKSIPEHELEGIIAYIHGKGMHVQLRPMLECEDGNGRHSVVVGPDSPRVGKPRGHMSAWFASMRERSRRYAQLAERTKCEMYCLDSEFDRFIMRSEQWRSVVAAVREVYSGLVTSCHTIHCHDFDWEAVVSDRNHWFHSLDLLSVSDYWEARAEEDNAPPSVERMMRSLEPHRETLRRVAAIYGKPLVFGECGCGCRRFQAKSPSGCSLGNPPDEEEQAAYYEAFLRTFKDEPWCRGFYPWRWTDPTWDDPDRCEPFRFSPRGHRAEKVLKDLYCNLATGTPPCGARPAEAKTTKVMLFFDTEDFTSDRSNDAIRDIAGILSEEGVVGNFNLVGLLCQELMRLGRDDVLQALKPHCIGTQTYGHSLHPTICEVTDLADYAQAYRNAVEMETRGIDLIRKATGVGRVVFQCPPGNSWSYVSFYAYADMGIRFIGGSGFTDHPIDSGGAYGAGGIVRRGNVAEGLWLCNVYHVPYSHLFLLEDMLPRRGIPEPDYAAVLDRMAQRDTVSLYMHPHMAVKTRHWDGPNYKGRNHVEWGKWIQVEDRPAAETETFYARFRSFVRRIKADPRFELTDLSRLEKTLKPRVALRRSDLPTVRQRLRRALAPVSSPASWSVADVFQAVCRFLTTSEKSFMPGKAYGFLENPVGVTSTVVVTAEGLRKAAASVDLSTFLPASVDVDGNRLGPADFLLAALDVLVDGTEKASVEPKDQLGSFEDVPSLRLTDIKGGWCIHAETFEDRHLSRRLPLQIWTMRYE